MFRAVSLFITLAFFAAAEVPTNPSAHRVGISSDGNIVVAWQQKTDTWTTVKAAYCPKSSTWQSPLPLSTTAGDSYLPALGVNGDGNSLCVWQKYGMDISRFKIAFATSTFDDPWSGESTVYQTSLNNLFAPVAKNNSNNSFVALWERIESNLFFTLQASTRFSPQMSWSTPQNLSSTNPIFGNPQIALNNHDRVAAIWLETANPLDPNDHRPIVTAAMANNGASNWTPSTHLSELGQIAKNPQIVIDDSTPAHVIAVWQESVGNNFVIQARSLSFGGQWGDKKPLSNTEETAVAPQIAFSSSGRAVAVWQTGFDGVIQASVYSTSTGEWTLQNPPLSGSGAANPTVAINADGAAIVAWEMTPEGENTQIETICLTAMGAWENPNTFSSPNTNCFLPQVAIGDLLDAAIIWKGDTGTDTIIQGVVSWEQGPWSSVQNISQ